MQGVKLGLNGKYREAVSELSQAVEQNSNFVVAYVSWGVALHRLGNDDHALSSYDRALNVDAKHGEAHYFRANIFYPQKNVPQGIAGYTIAIGLQPALIEAHRKPPPQGRLTDYSQNPAEMYWIFKPAYRILKYDQSLAANPRQADVYKERGTAYYELWNYEQAIADYSSAWELGSRNAQVIHYRGLAYEQLGQFDRALEDYGQAIATDPKFSDAYINRGVTYGKIGNLQQALASLSEGIRLAPNNPDGYFNRGTAYFQQSNFEDAIADFSQVLQIASDDEAAYYWRGNANEKAGHKREAIADYRRFLQLSRNPRAKEEVEQKLRQLK